MRAAAGRWQADYVEVTANSHPHLHPTFGKCGAVCRLKGYERVAYFDADMLIRSDAPNVFHILDDPERLYAVPDLARLRPYLSEFSSYNIVSTVRGSHHKPVAEWVGVEVEYDRFIRNFFNAGFFLSSPKRHQALFEAVESRLPPPGHPMADNAHFEQALFNYVVQMIDPSVVCYAPETWNYIDPDLRDRRMDSFVYHFTGVNHERLKPAVHTFPWTA